MELANGSQLCLKEKKRFRQKFWATVTQNIKAVLGWKFWIQDLLYEPKVLPMSLAHLVARMGWAHVKDLKETNSYLSNHTSSVSPISRMSLGHA